MPMAPARPSKQVVVRRLVPVPAQAFSPDEQPSSLGPRLALVLPGHGIDIPVDGLQEVSKTRHRPEVIDEHLAIPCQKHGPGNCRLP